MKKLIITLALLLSISSLNAQWVHVWNGMGQTLQVRAILNSGATLLAGLRYDGIYKSTNEGLSWSVTSENNTGVWHIMKNGINFYASTDDGILISNNGTNWTSLGLTNRRVYETASNNSFLFAATDNYGVYYSSNNGGNWTQSFLNNKDVWSLAVNYDNVVAGTNDNGIYYSTDNGYIWNQSHLNNIDVECLKFDGAVVYAGTANGIFKSSNYGVNWAHFGLAGKYIYDILINTQYIYAATDNSGIYVSTKQGLAWNQINDGFPAGNFDVTSLVFTDNYIVAGTYAASTWRRPISQVGITNIKGEIPSSFSLSQNYPNPFNPTTKIKFNVPKNEFVNIRVFDMLGKEIESLVNEQLKPGSYEVDWNASDFSSGIYFYKMQSGYFPQTKQMILLK